MRGLVEQVAFVGRDFSVEAVNAPIKSRIVAGLGVRQLRFGGLEITRIPAR